MMQIEAVCSSLVVTVGGNRMQDKTRLSSSSFSSVLSARLHDFLHQASLNELLLLNSIYEV